ncbi:MAG: hypothetical protein ACWGQW_17805, partial [bacterium]
ITADEKVLQDSVQEGIAKKVYKIPVEPTGGSSAPGLAAGGPVRGPGTGTSDSIMAWLSHGEYVIDAATTRFFGSAFFRNLQYAVRKGLASPKTALTQMLMPALQGKTVSRDDRRETITRMISSIAGLPGFARGGPVAIPNIPATALRLPAFASGGAVDSVDGGLVQAVGSLIDAQRTTPAVSERVQLDFAIGSDRFSVNGSREQVRGLVNALKDVSRSTRRG